eukprot:3191846-Rhodomonas_salina.1
MAPQPMPMGFGGPGEPPTSPYISDLQFLSVPHALTLPAAPAPAPDARGHAGRRTLLGLHILERGRSRREGDRLARSAGAEPACWGGRSGGSCSARGSPRTCVGLTRRDRVRLFHFSL